MTAAVRLLAAACVALALLAAQQANRADLEGVQEGDCVRIRGAIKSTLKSGTSRDGKPYEFWNTRLNGIKCENLTPPPTEQPPYDEADLTGGVEVKRPLDASATESDLDEEIPF